MISFIQPDKVLVSRYSFSEEDTPEAKDDNDAVDGAHTRPRTKNITKKLFRIMIKIRKSKRN